MFSLFSCCSTKTQKINPKKENLTVIMNIDEPQKNLEIRKPILVKVNEKRKVKLTIEDN